MPFADFAKALLTDAAQTTGRIKKDALHLRDLGRAAKQGGKAAILAVRSTAETALGDLADTIDHAYVTARGQGAHSGKRSGRGKKHGR